MAGLGPHSEQQGSDWTDALGQVRPVSATPLAQLTDSPSNTPFPTAA